MKITEHSHPCVIFLSVLTRVFFPALQRLFQPNINKLHQVGLACFLLCADTTTRVNHCRQNSPERSHCSHSVTCYIPQLWGPKSKNICQNKVQCFRRPSKWKSLEVSHTDNTLKEALEIIYIWKSLSVVFHFCGIYKEGISLSQYIQTMITLRGQPLTIGLFHTETLGFKLKGLDW